MGDGRAFIRWQSITITQLGYAINLILGLATASLGFSLSLAKDEESINSSCLGKHFLLMTVLMLLASIGTGIWCVINRLRDFRETESIARDNELGRLTQAEHARRKAATDEIGELTWLLFKWQIGLFAVGLVTLVIVFALLYGNRLT